MFDFKLALFVEENNKPTLKAFSLNENYIVIPKVFKDSPLFVLLEYEFFLEFLDFTPYQAYIYQTDKPIYFFGQICSYDYKDLRNIQMDLVYNKQKPFNDCLIGRAQYFLNPNNKLFIELRGSGDYIIKVKKDFNLNLIPLNDLNKIITSADNHFIIDDEKVNFARLENNSIKYLGS